jgi:hypothetical protein
MLKYVEKINYLPLSSSYPLSISCVLLQKMDIDEQLVEKDKNSAGIKQYYISKVEELEVPINFVHPI